MKKFVTIALAAVMLVAGMISGSIASQYCHGNMNYMGEMSEMDGNQDSLLSFEEFSAPQMDRLRSAFNMLDANNDDVIDKNEWDEFLKIHGYVDNSEGS